MTEQSSAGTTQNDPGRRSSLANSANPHLIPGSSRLVDTSSLPLRVGGSTAGQSHHIPPQEDALQQPHHAHHHFMIDPNSPALPRLSPNTPDANFPYNNNANNNNLHSTHRHMTLWDLLSLGVGGTVGSGIFVLTGQIASQMAGPATVLSWCLAGVAATTSALSLCELASRIPATGSTYVYCHACGLGTYAAVLAAACLTLEYVVSGAAVARTWGDKVVWWLAATFDAAANQEDLDPTMSNNSDSSANNLQTWEAWLQPYGLVNIPAMSISAACTVLLLMGVKESKTVANFFTVLKMILVGGMILGGFCLFEPGNFSKAPLMPFEMTGVLRGATSSFFGYLGYDEVCVVAGEALNPTRDVPRAILLTLLIVTICYVLASIALIGMEWYEDISPTAGFPAAFANAGWHAASQVAAAGELITLPLVVLISLLAQPRLTYSMAQDGTAPAVFERVDSQGNMVGGILIWGVIMTVTAALVPFTYLDDLISCGILVAFCLANACLILLRYQQQHPTQSKISSRIPSSASQQPKSPSLHPNRLFHALLIYNALCCFSALLWSHSDRIQGYVLAGILSLAALATVSYINGILHAGVGQNDPQYRRKHRAAYDVVHEHDEAQSNDEDDSVGEARHPSQNDSHGLTPSEYFETPWVPWIPCAGTALNWYLIAQLEPHGLLLLLVYLGGALLVFRTFQLRRRQSSPYSSVLPRVP